MINLNVGGKIFATRLSTLRNFPDSMLAAMFSGRHHLDQDALGNYFIDRDGTHFSFILNYLRNGDVPPPEFADAVLREGIYYGLDSLVDRLKMSPQVFAEHVVKSNLRKKLHNFEEVKRNIVSLACQQATEKGVTKSSVYIVVTKNQPIPGDLQLSHQVSKQFYRKYETFSSFESLFGNYYIHVPVENLFCHPDQIMSSIIRCLLSDLNREGFKATAKMDTIYREGNKIKTITWSDDDFHVCMSIYIIHIDWLAHL